MPTEEMQINPKLTDYELRLMKPESRHTKTSRFIFKSIHKFAVRFKLKRLKKWSYLKWLNTYSDDPIGFWRFAGDYIECGFTVDEKSIGW